MRWAKARHNRLDQHKAFGKLAQRIREGKADIPKQTEHSAERACRRNLFLPFQTERNRPPLAQFSGNCLSDHCTLSTFGILPEATPGILCFPTRKFADVSPGLIKHHRLNRKLSLTSRHSNCILFKCLGRWQSRITLSFPRGQDTLSFK